MPEKRSKFVEALPVFAFLGYLVYTCLICALLTGDARLLKIGFVASPVLVVSVLSLIKIFKGQAPDA